MQVMSATEALATGPRLEDEEHSFPSIGIFESPTGTGPISPVVCLIVCVVAVVVAIMFPSIARLRGIYCTVTLAH